MEQSGIRELSVDSLNVSVHQTCKDRGHAAAGSTVQTAGEDSGEDGHSRVPGHEMGSWESLKRQGWIERSILVYSGV